MDNDDTLIITAVHTNALARISQEACANAFGHGQANSITIILLQRDTNISFRITDDSSGIEQNKEEREDTTHIGIASPQKRAANIVAQLTIKSEIGVGTNIEVYWPLV